eukprot:s4400_g4.t1
MRNAHQCIVIYFKALHSQKTEGGFNPWQVNAISNNEWDDVGASLSTLIRLAFGAMDLEGIQEVSKESPLLIIVIVLFMMLVYSFFFNLLVSQFCGVYTSLAADIKGHARLARGEIIIETFKAVKLTRWQKFMTSLDLDSGPRTPVLTLRRAISDWQEVGVC